MGLGILEDRSLERVPGTSPLNDSGLDVEDASADKSALKHDVSGRIVLVPQPSDSPNDPYNWPRWKKELFMLTVLYGCGCVGGIAPVTSRPRGKTPGLPPPSLNADELSSPGSSPNVCPAAALRGVWRSSTAVHARPTGLVDHLHRLQWPRLEPARREDGEAPDISVHDPGPCPDLLLGRSLHHLWIARCGEIRPGPDGVASRVPRPGFHRRRLVCA